jgi:hypothetical protein
VRLCCKEEGAVHWLRKEEGKRKQRKKARKMGLSILGEATQGQHHVVMISLG